MSKSRDIADSAATINFIDNVSSDAQAQLNAKAPLASPTFTGTVTIPDATVTGDIAVSGTVDGRDVATDGTKLDGIEAGATADQTAAEILTAVKTVDGAASGLDADLLDGQQGSYYTGYADTAISNLVAAAPGALDTLNELAAALGDDASFSTTVTNSLALKAPLASPTFTGTVTIPDATVTGDIAVSGTVDGRDVATDGTKLDGIEALADVTDTANVTAAGALMDSEVTNLAEVKAFDSADYATAAQGTTADAALPKTGGAMTGAITTNSTFDGRDVATDGTKLDSIESGATADQTASEILTAVKTVDGAASGLDADLLDGQQGSYYTGYADTAVANLVASAPSTLDTLNELAAALGDDANFSTTVTNSLALKAPLASPTFTGTVTATNYTDTVYALSGTALDPANGGIQTKTLSANTTFTDSLASGESMVLQLEGASTYTVTWPTITWTTSSGNVAPTLTAKDAIVLWKVSTVLYGAAVGSYA